MQKIYVDKNGKFLGSFDCSALPEGEREAWLATTVPRGAVEVFEHPQHGLATWTNGAWVEPEAEPEPINELDALKAVLIEKGVITKAEIGAKAEAVAIEVIK